MRSVKDPKGIKFWLFFCSIVVLMVGASIQNYVTTMLSPYDITKLEDGEVFFNKHNFGEATYSLKLAALKSRGGADILIVGNHMTRSVYDDRGEQGLDVFNLVYGNTGLRGSLDLMRVLEQDDLLPRKALVVTMLTHQELWKQSDVPFVLEKDRPVEASYEWITKVPHLLEMNTVFAGGAALFTPPVKINHTHCLAVHKGERQAKLGAALTIRKTIARFMPVYFSLATGLLNRDEICSVPQMFRDIDFDSLTRTGGYKVSAPDPNYIKIRQPYPLSGISDAEFASHKETAINNLRHLQEYADTHGFRLIILFPPRYEEPLNSARDEMSNQVFTQEDHITVLDFRRFSMDRSLYYDNTHVGAGFRRLLLPCLDQILSSDPSLISKPAVGEHGRTLC